MSSWLSRQRLTANIAVNADGRKQPARYLDVRRLDRNE